MSDNASLREELLCDVCAGTGSVPSGRTCICGGSGFIGDAFRNLRRDFFDQLQQLATTREIARELVEALESVTTWAGRDNRRLSLSWADKIHSLNVASAAINKARAAGILNAPEEKAVLTNRAAIKYYGSPEGAKWQPIATAPKDGTKILACDESGSRYVASWDGYQYRDGTVIGWTDRQAYPSNPMYWMPLPDPPTNGPETAPAAAHPTMPEATQRPADSGAEDTTDLQGRKP